jgi:hypothetical protein
MSQPCIYGQPTPYEGLSFCQSGFVHAEAVGNLVDARKCGRCVWANEQPSIVRPVPSEWPAEPSSLVASQASRHAECRNLGAKIRAEKCSTCCGNVQVKVFACSIHGECTLAKQLGEIKCCEGCGDYAPAKEQE